MKIAALILIGLMFAGVAHAQTSATSPIMKNIGGEHCYIVSENPPACSGNLPDSPVPQDGASAPKPAVKDSWLFEYRKPQPHLLSGIATHECYIFCTAEIASVIAMDEGTLHCLHDHQCSEGNPIFGSHPSRLRIYGTTLPILAVHLGASSGIRWGPGGHPKWTFIQHLLVIGIGIEEAIRGFRH